MGTLQGDFLVASGSWKMEVFVGNAVGDAGEEKWKAKVGNGEKSEKGPAADV